MGKFSIVALHTQESDLRPLKTGKRCADSNVWSVCSSSQHLTDTEIIELNYSGKVPPQSLLILKTQFVCFV
jgi:hypothetical protein